MTEQIDSSQKTIRFDNRDITAVDTYRKQKNTSVLTIMFTDIKGFTRLTEDKGDEYANRVRRLHDDTLRRIIEEDGAGKIIKHIGDAVMAVFSEPSAAVEKSMEIQHQLHALNRDHDDLEDILVRIGLHMGQVTTENEVDFDVFGRHVNRASRVENLADGDQIYMTYPVFDSAKGWLLGRKASGTRWKSHGRYFVKGIDSAIEIYEVYHVGRQRPKPPAKARKKRNLPTLIVALLLILAGAGSVLLFAQMKKTSVVFVNFPNWDITLDHSDTTIMIDGEPGQRMRNLLTGISPGKHVLHWDYSYMKRYYAEIDVERGENVIEPKFTDNCLPSLSRHISYSKDENTVETSSTFTYNVYGSGIESRLNTADLVISVAIEADQEDSENLIFTYDWHFSLNGEHLNSGPLTVTNRLSNDETVRRETVIYSDDYHYYSIRYYIIRNSTELEIGSGYIGYLPDSPAAAE